MVRLFIDKLGSGHQDLFLKINVTSENIAVADSYYLFDFLEISDEEYSKMNFQENQALKYSAHELLKFWKSRLEGIERGQKKFLPFDLSDQYIGGLMVESKKLGFKTTHVYTDKIVGSSVSKSNLDEIILNIVFEKSLSSEWLIGYESFFKGLEWSINELRN